MKLIKKYVNHFAFHITRLSCLNRTYDRHYVKIFALFQSRIHIAYVTCYRIHIFFSLPPDYSRTYSLATYN